MANNRRQFFVGWNVEEIFNMNDEEVYELSSLIYGEDDLKLIRCKDYLEIDQDPQIGLYFLHDGGQW